MPMNKADLFDAFRKAASVEFEDIPPEICIDYAFSVDFECKLKKLIKKEKQRLWHFINTGPKRVIIIMMVFALLFSTACSIPSIREPICSFFVEVYKDFVHYVFEDGIDSIKTKYKLIAVPSGFSKTTVFETESIIVTTYENSNGDYLEFSQTITDDVDLYLDSERGELTVIDTTNVKYYLYTRENLIHIVFVRDSYVFNLTYQGELEKEVIFDIATSMAAVE